jgi:flagellin
MISIHSIGSSLNITRAISGSQKSLTRSLERVSSGHRVNRAADDAAGLGVATTLETHQQGLRAAVRNTNDGISIIQTAESAVNSTVDLLQRMRELAIQAASETLATDSRSFAQDEYQELKNQVKSVSSVTQFNGIKLTDNTTPTISVQVGSNNSSADRIDITMANLNATLLSIGSTNISFVANANTSLDSIDTAVTALNSDRSVLGAAHNRLLAALDINDSSATSMAAAESRILDTDYASETARLAKSHIIRTAGLASLSQAKNIHRSVVTLL